MKSGILDYNCSSSCHEYYDSSVSNLHYYWHIHLHLLFKTNTAVRHNSKDLCE